MKFIGEAREVYGCAFPATATGGSAGFDLRAIISDAAEKTLAPGQRVLFGTGLCIAPKTPNVAAFIYSRSGLGARQGLTVAQGVGIIDPDYRGEIQIYLLNTSQESQTVRHGDRIAQMVFQPYFSPTFNEVAELDSTARGSGGFGHTGTR